MTEEDKNLLLKDLSARLPYEVKGIRTYKPEEIVTLGEIIPRCQMNPNVGNGSFCELGFDEISDCCTIAEFKPYLRPMSSMTEEEEKEFCSVLGHYDVDNNPYEDFNFGDDIDWLNFHHVDYRGLIEKGLALEAPEGMYEIQD